MTTDTITARRVGAIALGLIAAQLVVRAVLVIWGNFYWDDLILIGRASSHSIVSWDYLGYSHDGHFMPGAFLLAGLTTVIAPVQWWLPAVTLVVLQALASLAVWRMIAIIAPRARAWGLVALTFYLFVPMTVSAYAWWAAGLNTLPMQAAMAVVVGNVVRLVRDQPKAKDRLRLEIGAVVAFAVGLLFFEKSLFILPVAFVAAIVVMRSVSSSRSDVADYRESPLSQTFLRARTLWLTLACMFIAWVVVFFATSTATAGSHSVAQTAKLVWRSINEAIIPSLAGGPWVWDRWTPSPPMGFPNIAMIIAGWAVLIAVIALTCRAKRGAATIWVFALAYAVLAQVPVMWNRSSDNTALELAQTMRYLPDTALVLTIALALIAASPNRGGAHAQAVVQAEPDRRPAYAAIAATVIFAVSAMVATMSFGQSWRDDPTGDYIVTARASLAQMDGKTMFDQPVPLEVLLPVAFPNNMISHVFGRLDKRPDFGTVTDDLKVLNPQGQLVAGAVTPQRTFKASRGSCAKPRIDGPTKLDLSGPLIQWRWTVGFSYCADRDGIVEMQLGNGMPVKVPVRQGLHPIYVQFDGSGLELRVRPVTPGLRLHTGDGRVGEAVMAEYAP